MRAEGTKAPFPLVIVGSGSAGLAAAKEAARHGLRTLVLDESAPADGLAVSDYGLMSVANGVSVLNISSDREILWAKGDTAGRFRAEQIILATGENGLVIPFPGWTLPGVVQSARLRAAIEAGEVTKGQTVLVSGTRFEAQAMLLQLHDVGVRVARCLVLEDDIPQTATRFFEVARSLHSEILTGQVVYSAHGSDRVEAARFGSKNSIPASNAASQGMEIEVDLVLVGFGRVPRNDLATLAGCRLEFSSDSDQWCVVRDESMRTSVPGIFSVGDRVDLASNREMFRMVAKHEAKIAAIAASEAAGQLTPAQSQLERQLLANESEFVTNLLEQPSFHVDKSVLARLPHDSTVVCRCEGVTCGAVRAAVANDACDVSSVKLQTRLGMGVCQGRECSPFAEILIAQLTGQPREKVGRINPRPPARPVSLGALANVIEGSPLDLIGGAI